MTLGSSRGSRFGEYGSGAGTWMGFKMSSTDSSIFLAPNFETSLILSLLRKDSSEIWRRLVSDLRLVRVQDVRSIFEMSLDENERSEQKDSNEGWHP